ncbi:MAG: magnesium/cobalt transporter CorA [Acidobacteriota bacterium]|nr:MAG: magnesium/cobalt transporter CorA [Acidobacteriota bacterium]
MTKPTADSTSIKSAASAVLGFVNARPVRRKRRKREHRPGLAPGTLIAEPGAPPPSVSVIGYGPEEMIEQPIEQLDDLAKLRGRWPVLWVNVVGVGHTDSIARIGELFGLHPLALEDVVNAHQRAKVDVYPDVLFVVAHIVGWAQVGTSVDAEQISLFVGRDFVLTFQHHEGDCFENVRERVRKPRKQLRTSGPDYLAYALLDAIVDHYFPLFEKLGDWLERLEDEVLENPDRETVATIRRVKRQQLELRRTAWPLREAVHALLREDVPLISADTRVFLRDCYDHTLRVLDLQESYREQVGGLMDAYLSTVSHRMNEVMALLTIVATIFIPLSFIAGLYGMNFDPAVSPWNMPELGWYFGYPLALGLMLAVGGGMLIFFRRRGWIGSPRARRRHTDKDA